MIFIVQLKCTIKTIDPEDKYNLPVRAVSDLDLVEHGRDLAECVKLELDQLGEWLNHTVPPRDPEKSNIIAMPGGGKFPQKEEKPR